MNFVRYLDIQLPHKQSAFLWGARKTGKSTYLRTKFPNSMYYDLLKSDLFLRFSKAPYLLREEILALEPHQFEQPIILDEIQKIPLLLDEIQWLIENTPAQFILCGSSARKLKQTGANLLGGRAWKYAFFPLVYPEIKEFNLLHALNHGTVPSHYKTTNIHKSLKAYVEDYLTHEIKAEGLIKNLPAFARFLDSLGFSNGQMTNYTNIARECGVDAKTVKEYYQILIDTLLGYNLYPYKNKARRDLITATPKFYLFDVGVAGALSHRRLDVLKGSQAGQAFEHYMLTELIAYKGLKDLDFEITYWRTKTGLEVDFVLGDGVIAIEVKITDTVQKSELTGLLAFIDEYTPRQAFVVCLEPRPRVVTHCGKEIQILPVHLFLEKLWSDALKLA